MIAYFKGKILERNENLIILEVNNVVYEINISLNTYLSLSNKNECELYTYLQVKEDGISLFGFSTKGEKELFTNLITVNGVGPKMAITILSGASIADIITSIVSEDSKMLSKFKGVGKKTAERIILELKEKLGENMKLEGNDLVSVDLKNDVVNDCIMALVALGLTKSEAVKRIKENMEGTDTVETLIEKILKNLSR